MIGVIVATHGEFGLVLLSTLRMILGETEGIVAIDLVSQDSMESFQSKMEKALETVDPKGSGALVLVDMLGGTPFNVALRLSQTRKLQVVTGVNLPMLIKVASDRDGTQLERLAQDVQAATRESIVTSLELLKKQG
ncbi:MAG TPA: PTS sugar transporter subunit IIA [bacterium]|jgi:PTS system mannose-specific IIA component|nr:PTS sugar transporter subunit IIA [bacterium]